MPACRLTGILMMNIYRARWIIPIEGPPIEHGILAVDNGQIVQVASAHEKPGLTDSAASSIQDFGESILLPGFVNAHTHLELTCYRDQLSPGPLWTWLEQLTALRFRSEAEPLEREAVRIGAAESLAAGVTCVGDISRTGLSVEVLKKSPIRKVCFLELISGASRPPNDASTLATAFEHMAKLAEPERLVIGVSPHAVYSVVREELSAVATLAKATRAPLTMHLLETDEEVAWLARGEGVVAEVLNRHSLPNADVVIDTDVLEWLSQTGVLSGSPLLAHVNYVSDRQLDRLAESRATVVWCPRAHRFFGHANHRWRAMLSRRVNVCVGTDSAASNESLSILDELRLVRRNHPDVPPEVILEMGTLRGAVGLGLDDIVGSLKLGKRADFVKVPVNPNGDKDPVLNLLDGEKAVDGVWVDGAAVV
ncbi:MAG: amidohydrolase family protein [Phycisphaerales bacterium]|nr:amidohydrolase family protein [Phycisphaerales bacterium]